MMRNNAISKETYLDFDGSFSCFGVGKLAGLFSAWRPVIRRKAMASSRAKASTRESAEIFFFIENPYLSKRDRERKSSLPLSRLNR
jgi:hypothetical protein